ncbi:hypothetical protein [Nocardia alba]|uniref:Uncharacterized protein n=1 Tax=Nocardia alba TaxID=225051 RepID=A0A4R1FAW6_9NOCA|nr:hypothetical protein [Nocardia alba]TCJ89934.1 hypothetical protein DFR71_6224 [Nocardia alba]
MASAEKVAHRLRALPNLDHYEIHVGSLTSNHIDRTIAIRTASAVITGPLASISESLIEGGARVLLRIRTDSTIGELTLGLHPAHLITVLPPHHTLTVAIAPKPKPDC